MVPFPLELHGKDLKIDDGEKNSFTVKTMLTLDISILILASPINELSVALAAILTKKIVFQSQVASTFQHCAVVSRRVADLEDERYVRVSEVLIFQHSV